MALLEFGLAGLTILMLVSLIVGAYIGPVLFFGYIIYFLGWMMVGHGVTVFWMLKLNSSYLFAIYPVAAYVYKPFWNIFLWANRRFGGHERVDNILARSIFFLWFAFMSLGAWFVTGIILMSVGSSAGVNSGIFDGWTNFITEHIVLFEVFYAVMTISTLIGFYFNLWKLLIPKKKK